MASDHGAPPVRWEGVALRTVLEQAGVEFGTAMRGAALTMGVVVEAADGYRVLFALAELDPAFSSRTILLVDRKEGGELSEAEGPLRIVAPGDSRGARWARQVTTLRVIAVPEGQE